MESRQVFLLLFLILNGMVFGILSVSAGMTLDQFRSLERNNTDFDRPWMSPRALIPTIYGLQNGCSRVQKFYPRIGYPGTKVVITGQNLGDVTDAKFATNASAKIERVNDTEICVIVPPGAESGPIQITKPGCSNIVLNSFTVPPQPKITLSPAVVVANVNGTAAINVKFGVGIIAPTILSISSSQPSSVSVPSLIVVMPGASDVTIKASVLSSGPPAEITVTLPVYMGGGSARAVVSSGGGNLMISNVSATNITPNSALITWNTNLYCDSLVEYGISSVYSNQTAWQSTYLTSHLVTITGLMADKTYNYRVRSGDIAGNLVTSGNFTFNTTSPSTPKPSPTPKPSATPTPTPKPSPTPTPRPSTTPTPTPRPSLTPTPRPSSTPMPRPLPMPTPAPTPMPSGTAFLEGIRSFTGAQFVEWTGIIDASMSNGLLMKTAGCDGCEATAYAKQAIYKGDGYFEVVVTETNLRRSFGLMTANKKVTAANLDFSISLGNNTAEVRELGVSRTKTDFRPGDVFRVVIEGGKVKYSKNYIVFYQSNGTPTYPFVGAVAFQSSKSSIGRSRIASLVTVK